LRGIDLADVAEEFGTPLFVFDETRLRENYRRFSGALKEHYAKTVVCYSVKTNNNLAICKIMQEEGAYAEVGSGLDFYIAKKAGFAPEQIVFDGLYKPEEALRDALRDNIFLIDAESQSELEILNSVAGEIGKKPNIGIRVNTEKNKFFNSETIYCNPLSRFGFSFEDAYNIFKHASSFENLEICGVMIHPYWGIHQLLPFVRRLQNELKVEIRYINFGGGFSKGSTKIGLPHLFKDALRQKLGIESKLDFIKTKKPRSIEEAGKLIAAEVGETLANTEPTLIYEPGRYIVHDAGLLLLKAQVVKKASGFQWVVVDGGTNLNTDWLERREIRIVNRASSPVEGVKNVVGPLLFARDFVTIKQRLPKVMKGDVLAVFNSGAYTLSNSTQFLNPRPKAILVRADGKVVEIREREKYEDVSRMDESI
jgi:diaminopimelate decarboxylase